MSANENIDVARPIRLSASEEVPKIGCQPRFASRILCRGMVDGLRTAEKIAESGEGSVGVRFWFIGGIQRGQQPFGRHAIEVAERSWARTSGLGGVLADFAGCERRHEQSGERPPGN